MFWILSLAMVVLVLIPVLRSVLSHARSNTKNADRDLQVYKDQLTEVEKDVARGVLSEADAQAAKTEVSRRILMADKRASEETSARPAGRKTSLALSLVITMLLLGGSFALYQKIGSSGMKDHPLLERIADAKKARENRPSQAEAEAAVPPFKVEVDENHAALVEKLRNVLKDRPNDPEGFRLLANHEARMGNLAAARVAQQRVITILGDATQAADYTDLAEIMIVAAGGYVSPEAEDSLSKALSLNVKSPRARYYSGLALAQNGRADIAYNMWNSLLQEGPENAPWIPLIREQIGFVAREAGITPPIQNAPGPSSEDVQNAQDMTAEDRQQMIRSMVAQLAERLATDGGSGAEWARLIRAYGVLGETDKAAKAWEDAKAVFAQDSAEFGDVSQAAQAAGLTP